jgi:ubiquitin-conjugating enzyme (huntingtin interacting protein 2)
VRHLHNRHRADRPPAQPPFFLLTVPPCLLLQKELKEIDSDKASGVTAEVVDDNLQHLIGCVPGPKDTPYEGGVFRVDIQLDAQYPFAPPKMRFMTRVWHPNVSSANGAICLGERGRGAGRPCGGHPGGPTSSVLAKAHPGCANHTARACSC